MLVLGIETSCDETGVAVYDTDEGLLSDVLYSQIELHAKYGGVVPELASRDHVQRIIPLVDEALTLAKKTKSQLEGVAYTEGPGLMGALLVGAAVGKSLAWSLGIPSIGVHHMEGHLLAPMLNIKGQKEAQQGSPDFPFLGLLVSGGHSLLVDVNGVGQYQVIGESLDDAIGEAFDKTAKLLRLGYPGGPAISMLAETGDASQYKFPRPMTNRPGLDMSFSGLKTFVLNTWESSDKSEQTKANVAAAFQEAVVDTLLIKCKRALKQTGYSQLVIAGGVSANKQLRTKMQDYADTNQLKVFFPDLKYCTDNGSMIAYAGALRLWHADNVDKTNLSFQTRPRWPLEELKAL